MRAGLTEFYIRTSKDKEQNLNLYLARKTRSRGIHKRILEAKPFLSKIDEVNFTGDYEKVFNWVSLGDLGFTADENRVWQREYRYRMAKWFRTADKEDKERRELRK